MSAYLTYRELRQSGQTPAQATSQLQASANAAYKYERRLRSELTPEEYASIATPHALRAQKAWKGSTPILPSDDPLPDLPAQSLGVLAEDFVYYQLRARGFEVYRPGYPISGTDLLVVKPDGRVARIEVKCTVDQTTVVLGRTENRSGSRTAYAEGLVDFYICVQLRNKLTLVIPKPEIQTSSVTMSPHSDYWKYRDAYHLISV